MAHAYAHAYDDGDGFDPYAAFDSVEPNMEIVERRTRTAVWEEAAARARADAARRAEALERERVERERLLREADRKEWLEQGRIMEERKLMERVRAAEQRELAHAEERRALSERIGVIIQQEKAAGRWKTSLWPEDATERELLLKGDAFRQLMKGLRQRNAGSILQVDDLPCVFPLCAFGEESRSETDYESLCGVLMDALKRPFGLYGFDDDLRHNLTNSYTRRLRSYYENMEWEAFHFINLVDAWGRLLRVLLAVGPDEGDVAGVYCYLPVTVHVVGCFESMRESLGNMLYAYNARPDVAEEANEYEIQKHIREFHEWACKEGAQLAKEVKWRRDRFQAWADMETDRRDSHDVRVLRGITQSVIEGAAQYFMDHPRDPTVAELRSVAYGHRTIGFDAYSERWLTALGALPEEALSWRSDLWNHALHVADARRGHHGKEFVLNSRRI